jgi:hypothetical protein
MQVTSLSVYLSLTGLAADCWGAGPGGFSLELWYRLPLQTATLARSCPFPLLRASSSNTALSLSATTADRVTWLVTLSVILPGVACSLLTGADALSTVAFNHIVLSGVAPDASAPGALRLSLIVNGGSEAWLLCNASTVPATDWNFARVGHPGTSSSFLMGYAAEVATYGAALSAERVLAHYYAGLPVPPPPPPPPSPSPPPPPPRPLPPPEPPEPAAARPAAARAAQP